MSEDYLIQQMLGFSGFGKKETFKIDKNEAISSSKRVISEEIKGETQKFPILQPPRKNPDSTNEIDSESESCSNRESVSDSDNEDFLDVSKNPEFLIPEKNELIIKNGTKQVSAVAVENSGTRLIAGGYDYDVNMWDFATMDHRMKPFRTFQPMECHHIRNLTINNHTSEILVAASNSQAKILDRDGRSLVECVKGDQYLMDMGQTKGHISMVYQAVWNPIEDDQFITSGQDGTIRLWNSETADKSNTKVIKVKNSKNKALHVTSCAINSSGKEIYASGMDGSIQSWDCRQSYISPKLVLRNAHLENQSASCLAIDRDDLLLTSRALDDTLKVWDLRKTKTPLHIVENLPNYYDTTKCFFTPDNKMIMTGTSIDKKNTTGHLFFYSVEDMRLSYDIPIDKSGVVCPIWNPKLNQLFVGCSDGNIRIFFDPVKSSKGVMLSMTKIKFHLRDPGESLMGDLIITPSNRKNEITANSIRKVKAKARADPLLARIPNPPCYGPGQGGRITSGMSLSSFVMKQMVIQDNHADDHNPREAILRYAQMAEEDPFFVTPAYKGTQPKQIFQSEPEGADLSANKNDSSKRFYSSISSYQKSDQEEPNKKGKFS